MRKCRLDRQVKYMLLNEDARGDLSTELAPCVTGLVLLSPSAMLLRLNKSVVINTREWLWLGCGLTFEGP